MPFLEPHLPEIIERLEAAGKEVLLSSLALISTGREWMLMRELVAGAAHLVEANEIGVVHGLAGRPHAIGPFVNIYNEDTLGFFAARGATRVCLPVELPHASIAHLASAAALELEVQVFGRLPLAISARCFHARAHRRHKDSCQFVCGNDADGLVVHTLENESFLAINGTQTLSYTCVNLIGELDTLRRAGVNRFRLSPHSGDMVRVAEIFRRAIAGEDGADAASAALAHQVPGMDFANGFFHDVAGRVLQDARGGEGE
jgi:collagenase-like PrtC family protease